MTQSEIKAMKLILVNALIKEARKEHPAGALPESVMAEIDATMALPDDAVIALAAELKEDALAEKEGNP